MDLTLVPVWGRVRVVHIFPTKGIDIRLQISQRKTDFPMDEGIPDFPYRDPCSSPEPSTTLGSLPHS